MGVEEKVKKFLKVIEEKNPELGAFLFVDKKGALARARTLDKKTKKGKLFGLCFAVKANINVIGMPISCSSKTLKDYIGTFNADVVQNILDEDGIILGMANQDEFACGIGGSGGLQKTKNPHDTSRVAGGSSSGSAVAVAAGMCDVALGSDTGGSIRNPASHCGIIGIKPSYGRVSRYGLIDLSMSLDQIGVLGNDIETVSKVIQIISGHSANDPTTFDKKVPSYSLKELQNVTIGVNKEFEELCTNKEIHKMVMDAVEKLGSLKNLSKKMVDLKYTKLGVQTYYPLVYTEFYSGTRKFDGRKYGKVIEQSCGEEVLRRILGGQEISKAEHDGKYYRKALAVKGLIKQDFDKAFEKVDFIVSPVTPELPQKFSDKLSPQAEYAMDAFTIPANLAGICAGVIPIGKLNGIPVGLQIMAPAFSEDRLLSFMKMAQEVFE
tara:strand:- start:439 stop:1749 length:1311 start_codon:yes stop_codon:yes gene_type:complete